jgi:hypothetical protein
MSSTSATTRPRDDGATLRAPTTPTKNQAPTPPRSPCYPSPPPADPREDGQRTLTADELRVRTGNPSTRTFELPSATASPSTECSRAPHCCSEDALPAGPCAFLC